MARLSARADVPVSCDLTAIRMPGETLPSFVSRRAVDPDLFMVDDAVWEHYIEPRERDKVICRGCCEFIRDACDKHSGRPGMDVIFRTRRNGPDLAQLIESAGKTLDTE